MSGYDPKYDRLLDAETWAFIRETESWYPPDAIGLTIEDQRAVYDKMCRAFHAGRPPQVAVEDDELRLATHAIPLRHYRSQADAKAQVMYLHGGGFVVGGLDSHDDVCAEICAQTGFDVTAVDYRLSPEHPFPDDIDDALAVAKTRSQKPLLLVGDSAGGNLCAAVASALCGTPLAPVGQVLIYPALGAPTQTQSAVDHAFAPMLTAQDAAFYTATRACDNLDAARNPRFSPLRATGFAGLPPTIVITAECDPLSDDGKLYCDRIVAAGGEAMHIEERGLVHGYLRARHRVARAGASFGRITAAISALGQQAPLLPLLLPGKEKAPQ